MEGSFFFSLSLSLSLSLTLSLSQALDTSSLNFSKPFKAKQLLVVRWKLASLGIRDAVMHLTG